ncbi:MAG TPA: hypothetical protein VI278_17095, partial [Nitrososphaeraceae archaeon]
IFGEFLAGYVAAIQSGGNVVNYLKSKTTSAFETLENTEKLGVEKISGVIHGWLTMQIVILALFILIAAVGANPMDGGTSGAQSDPPYVLLFFSPIMSVLFLKIVQRMVRANVPEIPVKKFLQIAAPSVLIVSILIFTNVISSLHIDAYLLGMALIISSILPALQFNKIYQLNIAAENATPQILRDITEARKAGMGPEKCIIRACKRKDFKLFNTVANSISNKLEWGVALNNIYDGLNKEIKNFQVLISFRILFEIISSGGGNVSSLDSLSDTSEKIYNIEKNKRESLKVYVMVGFMLITVTGFTTLLTIESFSVINEKQNLDKTKTNDTTKSDLFLERVSLSLVIQGWLSGLFIGKITKGSYSGGYVYSIMLVIITMASIALIQLHVVNFNALFKSA